MTVERHFIGKRMSQISVFNRVVYLSGQIPEKNLGAGIADQAKEVFSKIDELLASVGTDKSKILHCQIFLRDLADFGGMNAVWDEWVTLGSTPCRATVQTPLATSTCLIEVIATAALP